MLILLQRTLPALAGVAAILIWFFASSRGQDDASKKLDLSNYQLSFNEDFDKLDVSAWGPGTRWIAHTPWNGDFGDARFADPAPGFPFVVENGVLRIEARREADGKWRSGLLSSADPKGAGFLHVRPEWQALINPLVISHGWTADNKEPGVRGPFGNSAFVDEVEMQGTRDPAAWLAVPAALKFRREHDWWAVAADCSRLAQETAARLRELTGLPALSSPEFSAPQMVSMPIPSCDTTALKEALLDRYNIEIPVHTWHDRALVRLSVQGYNTRAQMDVLIGALSDQFGLGAPAARRAGR